MPLEIFGRVVRALSAQTRAPRSETFPVVLSASVSLASVTAPLLIFAVVTALFAIVTEIEVVPDPEASPDSVIVWLL